MTKQEFESKVLGIIIALNNFEGIPESELFVYFNNLQAWEKIRESLINSDVITVNSHYVRITNKGREVAKKINDALAAK